MKLFIIVALCLAVASAGHPWGVWEPTTSRPTGGWGYVGPAKNTLGVGIAPGSRYPLLPFPNQGWSQTNPGYVRPHQTYVYHVGGGSDGFQGKFLPYSLGNNLKTRPIYGGDNGATIIIRGGGGNFKTSGNGNNGWGWGSNTGGGILRGW